MSPVELSIHHFHLKKAFTDPAVPITFLPCTRPAPPCLAEPPSESAAEEFGAELAVTAERLRPRQQQAARRS